jgi:hypothetical protein
MDLEAIAPVLEQIIKESLEQKRYPFGFANYQGVGNKVASGRLKNSVKVNVDVSKQGYAILQVMMEDYGTYVQQGRASGKKGVPIQSLLDWIKDRKLKGRDAKGRFITNKSFAFAIQKNIKKYGIKPAKFIDVSVEKILEDPRIIELIGDSAVEELIDLIQGI